MKSFSLGDRAEHRKLKSDHNVHDKDSDVLPRTHTHTHTPTLNDTSEQRCSWVSIKF